MASVFETARVLFKITVTLVLAVLAARLAMRIGRPGEETRLPALLLVLPAVMVTAAVVAELVALPADAWRANLVGGNALFCLFFVPVLSLAPLAGLFWALKKGRAGKSGPRRCCRRACCRGYRRGDLCLALPGRQPALPRHLVHGRHRRRHRYRRVTRPASAALVVAITPAPRWRARSCPSVPDRRPDRSAAPVSSSVRNSPSSAWLPCRRAAGWRSG